MLDIPVPVTMKLWECQPGPGLLKTQLTFAEKVLSNGEDNGSYAFSDDLDGMEAETAGPPTQPAEGATLV